MGVISKLTNALGGSLSETILDAVKSYYPPKLSEAEKFKLEQGIKEQTGKIEIALRDLDIQEQAEFNKTALAYEGTASDLKNFGFVGRLVLFLRGMQRPMFGYMTMYADYKVFSGQWVLSGELTDINNPQTYVTYTFLALNIIVLTFLFGERAIKNILPLFFELRKKHGNG